MVAGYSTLAYRPDIQGLRAIAILLVILAHAEVSAFSGGFVGVDIFFVLSGYLITGCLVYEYATSGSLVLKNFYARRLKRLLPALLVMLISTVLLTPVLLSKHEALAQGSSVMYAVTWTSNLFFALSTMDYFNDLQTHDLFLHTWSLGVEEQFYLIWPVLLLLTFTLAARKVRRSEDHAPLFLMLGALFVIGIGLEWFLSIIRPMWAFYLMPSRIWQFALGACVFVWLHGIGDRGKNAPLIRVLATTSGWFGAIGLALIIGSAILLHRNLTYPGFWASLPSLGAALVIAAGQQSELKGVSRVLAHPALVWIGNRSYSWYLWHWPVLVLGFAMGVARPFVKL